MSYCTYWYVLNPRYSTSMYYESETSCFKFTLSIQTLCFNYLGNQNLAEAQPRRALPPQDLEADVDLLRQPAAGAPRAGRADRLRPPGDPHLRPGLRPGGGREAAEGRGRQAGLLGRLQELMRNVILIQAQSVTATPLTVTVG